MLKIRRIKLSGFRGILNPQELSCVKKGGHVPSSFVLFGVNSSGKTSFVDGLEWFLSPQNKIQWLRREDAQEAAYPHHAANDGESFVEVEFCDDSGKVDTLRKTFNHQRVTKPTLSSEKGFKKVYESFVIKPYFRYLEIVEFVLNRKGVEKYQELASWMGFEDELHFQEKIALKIVPRLENKKSQLEEKINTYEQCLQQLTGKLSINEKELLDFCNSLLKNNKISPSTGKSLNSKRELEEYILEISKLQIQTSLAKHLSTLSAVKTYLATFSQNSALLQKINNLRAELKDFTKDRIQSQNINVIDLYNKAQDILSGVKEDEIKCPVCGTQWKRKELLEHIKQELNVLSEVKARKEVILEHVKEIKRALRTEQDLVKELINKYVEVKKAIPGLTYEATKKYETTLEELETFLDTESIFVMGDIKSFFNEEIFNKVIQEKQDMTQVITKEENKIGSSKEIIQLTNDIDRLKKVNELWQEWLSTRGELNFFIKELDKFIEISNTLSRLIQGGIKKRFDEMSELIEKYFSILRIDKDIKDIQIDFNITKKAAGRSAEFQLIYYDILVRPAYKVLSESLLNSLGLSVYFACVKKFNKDCRFIVLDDIINSLDIHHRDTLIDLLEQEFQDYQMILFTHDDFWFEKLQVRFPSWIRKKIKDWDYTIGPIIDFAKTTKEELSELLKDQTKAKEAGAKLGEHLEGILSELCESLEAKMKYRYSKQELPTMNELFEALYSRLKEIFGKDYPLVKKIWDTWQSDTLIRNFCSHNRRNYSSSISSAEVKKSFENWFNEIEKEVRCPTCNKLIEYVKAKSQVHVQCSCGVLKLK